jgi:hypothetical protein
LSDTLYATLIRIAPSQLRDEQPQFAQADRQ